jgi:hypothetical protein
VKTRTVTLVVEVESGVVDPIKLHYAVEAIQRCPRGDRRADTDRWIVREILVGERQERRGAA